MGPMSKMRYHPCDYATIYGKSERFFSYVIKIFNQLKESIKLSWA
jgi:hypothetical protein